jgi:hypothetical protein
MYVVAVYFPGPRTLWAGKVAPEEIIARHTVPFAWLARARLRNLRADLNAHRCGFLLMRGETVLEHHEPPESVS